MSERIVIPNQPCETCEGMGTPCAADEPEQAPCPDCLGTGVALPASVTHPRRVEVGSGVEVLVDDWESTVVLLATVKQCSANAAAQLVNAKSSDAYHLSLTDYRRTPQ